MYTCIYRNGFGDTEEVEIEVEIRGDYVPYVPARTYGPPENCSPAEGGYAEDMVAIFDDNGKERFIQLTKEEEETFGEFLAEELADDEADKYDRAMEDRADAERERDW